MEEIKSRKESLHSPNMLTPPMDENQIKSILVSRRPSFEIQSPGKDKVILTDQDADQTVKRTSYFTIGNKPPNSLNID